VFHELAHGYHHQFLDGGFDHAEVKAAYDAARGSGSFERVLRIDGEEQRAYAATNPMEYFAEASESFFGTNDFYPFVRSELRHHDPALYELLKTVWESP
jgi:Mlc titration factor MtfA (ptsG expression regulator)